MTIRRLRQPEQHLQQAMHAGCLEQIAAARDVGDALARIVDDDREVIAGRYILAQDHRVTPQLRLRRKALRLAVVVEFGERQRRPAEALPRHRQRPFHVDAQGETLAALQAPVDLGPRQSLVQSRIERCAVGIDSAGRRCGLDLAARGKARIEQPLRLQPLRRLHIGGEVLRLPQHRLLPGDPEPGEIGEDAGDVLLATADDVDVLDAHQEAPAQTARQIKAGQRRQGMAEMQRAVGARRKA